MTDRGKARLKGKWKDRVIASAPEQVVSNALRPGWRWPNGRDALDYAPLSYADIKWLDQLVAEEELLPAFGPAEVLTICEPLPDWVMPCLNRIEVKAFQARFDGDAERLAIMAHAWHRLHERFVFPVGSVSLGLDEWRRLGEDSAGPMVYDSFVSIFELQRYLVSWIFRMKTWIDELLERQSAGAVVWRTIPQDSGRPGRVKRTVGVAKLAAICSDVRLVISSVKVPDWEGCQFSGYSAAEGYMHIETGYKQQDWLRRFELPADKPPLPQGVVPGSDEAWALRAEYRQRRRAANKLAYWIGHSHFHALLHALHMLETEAIAEWEARM